MSTLTVDDYLEGNGGETLVFEDILQKVRWVYDQTVPSITASYNVSSITDVAAGDHEVVLTNAFADDFFRCSVGGYGITGAISRRDSPPAAGTIAMITENVGGTNGDVVYASGGAYGAMA